jgi:hypothetical protein
MLCFLLCLLGDGVHAFQLGKHDAASVRGMRRARGIPVGIHTAPHDGHAGLVGGGAYRSVSLGAWPLSKDPKGMPSEFPVRAARMSVTTAATVLTWYVTQSSNSQRSNVLASAAVTLICSLAAPGLGQAGMCGSFAGMTTSALLLPNYKYAVGLGAVTSIFFELLIHERNAFGGVGGRLGATAFLATHIIAATQGVATGVTFQSIQLMKPISSTVIKMMGWHAVGSVATIALREASDVSAAADPVRAAAVVGLLASLLVGINLNGWTVFTEQAALAVYGGAFVGMSLPSRLLNSSPPRNTTWQLLGSFAMAGALGGWIHSLTNHWNWWLGGWGGKAGFCSFLGVLLYQRIYKSWQSLCKKSKSI